MVPIAWPQSPRQEVHFVAAVSPKCSVLCGPSLPGMIPTVWPKSMIPTLWPKSHRNLLHLLPQVSPKWSPSCGPSLPKIVSTVWLKSPRNAPSCVARVSPRGFLLCGQGPQEFILLCGQKVPTRCSLLCGPSLPEMSSTLRPQPPRSDAYCAAQVSPKSSLLLSELGRSKCTGSHF